MFCPAFMQSYVDIGTRDFITTCGALDGSLAATTSTSSRSYSFSNSGQRKEIRDLVHEACEARGWYSDVTREVGRLESDLAAVQATLRGSEEEMTLARVEGADVYAQVVDASLVPRIFVCFSFDMVAALSVLRVSGLEEDVALLVLRWTSCVAA
jgi:hypothetical protein